MLMEEDSPKQPEWFPKDVYMHYLNFVSDSKMVLPKTLEPFLEKMHGSLPGLSKITWNQEDEAMSVEFPEGKSIAIRFYKDTPEPCKWCIEDTQTKMVTYESVFPPCVPRIAPKCHTPTLPLMKHFSKMFNSKKFRQNPGSAWSTHNLKDLRFTRVVLERLMHMDMHSQGRSPKVISTIKMDPRVLAKAWGIKMFPHRQFRVMGQKERRLCKAAREVVEHMENIPQWMESYDGYKPFQKIIFGGFMQSFTELADACGDWTRHEKVERVDIIQRTMHEFYTSTPLEQRKWSGVVTSIQGMKFALVMEATKDETEGFVSNLVAGRLDPESLIPKGQCLFFKDGFHGRSQEVFDCNGMPLVHMPGSVCTKRELHLSMALNPDSRMDEHGCLTTECGQAKLNHLVKQEMFYARIHKKLARIPDGQDVSVQMIFKTRIEPNLTPKEMDEAFLELFPMIHCMKANLLEDMPESNHPIIKRLDLDVFQSDSPMEHTLQVVGGVVDMLLCSPTISFHPSFRRLEKNWKDIQKNFRRVFTYLPSRCMVLYGMAKYLSSLSTLRYVVSVNRWVEIHKDDMLENLMAVERLGFDMEIQRPSWVFEKAEVILSFFILWGDALKC